MKKMIQKIEAGFEQMGRWIYSHPKRVILVMLLFFASLASNLPSIKVDTSPRHFSAKTIKPGLRTTSSVSNSDVTKLYWRSSIRKRFSTENF